VSFQEILDYFSQKLKVLITEVNRFYLGPFKLEVMNRKSTFVIAGPVEIDLMRKQSSGVCKS